jgi:hypothetical protein
MTGKHEVDTSSAVIPNRVEVMRDKDVELILGCYAWSNGAAEVFIVNTVDI